LITIHLYSASMDVGEKLDILAASARYDASCASSGSRRGPASGGFGAATPAGVCHSFTGDGRCVSLLKILYSNQCRYDCAYCANRTSADIRRTAFTVDEIVALTVSFYRRNYIEGLFLSSGIFSDPDIVMGRLITVAKTLRQREKFGGYIHLKTIPGCSPSQMREAGLWADRLSVNIELPSVSSLTRLAPQKSGTEILLAMRNMHDMESESLRDSNTMRSAPRFAPAGQSTQLVVGASPDGDDAILRLAGSLYSRYGLRRVYYSAFVPVSSDPRLPPSSTPPLRREHRLYQADWLLRFYGFEVRELVGEGRNFLEGDIDPKTAWAFRHPDFYPIDLRSAAYEKILRVPGIGVTGARRILGARRTSTLKAEDLPKLGIAMKRARWFASLGGKPLEAPVDPERLAAILADPPMAPEARESAPAGGIPSPQLEFSFP